MVFCSGWIELQFSAYLLTNDIFPVSLSAIFLLFKFIYLAPQYRFYICIWFNYYTFLVMFLNDKFLIRFSLNLLLFHQHENVNYDDFLLFVDYLYHFIVSQININEIICDFNHALAALNETLYGFVKQIYTNIFINFYILHAFTTFTYNQRLNGTILFACIDFHTFKFVLNVF